MVVRGEWPDEARRRVVEVREWDVVRVPPGTGRGHGVSSEARIPCLYPRRSPNLVRRGKGGGSFRDCAP